jgi:hypothetical protein
MPPHEALIAELRQTNELYAASYAQNLAEMIAAMLPNDRDEARRVLAIVDRILSLEPPPPSEETS